MFFCIYIFFLCVHMCYLLFLYVYLFCLYIPCHLLLFVYVFLIVYIPTYFLPSFFLLPFPPPSFSSFLFFLPLPPSSSSSSYTFSSSSSSSSSSANLGPHFGKEGQIIADTDDPDDYESLNNPTYNQVIIDITTSVTVLVGIFFPSCTGEWGGGGVCVCVCACACVFVYLAVALYTGPELHACGRVSVSIVV